MKFELNHLKIACLFAPLLRKPQKWKVNILLEWPFSGQTNAQASAHNIRNIRPLVWSIVSARLKIKHESLTMAAK